MTDQGIQEKAINVVTILIKSVTSLRLYPLTSAIVNQNVDLLLHACTELLEENDPLILAESERTLLIDGEPADHKDQEKIQIRAFVEILTILDIRSITFVKGLEKEELLAFIQAMSLKQETARAEGGLQAILDRHAVRHILFNEKMYVTRDKDQQIISSMDLKDDDILSILMEADPESADMQQIVEKAKDPEWIGKIFQNGMRHIVEQQDFTPGVQLSEKLVHMVRMLEKIADPADQEQLADLVARSVTELDNEMISLVLSRDVRNLFGGRLFDNVIGELPDERFAEVADGLARMAEAPGELGRTAALSHEVLMNTGKGRRLESERQAREAQEKEERERRFDKLRERLQWIQRGDDAGPLDPNLKAELPGIVLELYGIGYGQNADEVLAWFTEKLTDPNPELGAWAAESLSQILEGLIAAGLADQASHLAEMLSQWFGTEIVFSPACERICRQLKELEQALLERDPFGEVHPILDALSMIQSGKTPRDPAMQAMAAGALRELATEGLLKILFHEFLTNERGHQKAASRNLARLGDAPVEELLDILRESEDSTERVRILQAITEIGAPAIPNVIGRIIRNEPWFVLRNLVYLLGRVGKEPQAADLAPLLLHANQRVQMEALKSLQRIGGKSRAEILISVLPKVDDALKMSIVETLSVIKAREAVPLFVEMLQAKPSGSSSLRADLEEKICNALGNIGVREALPALTEIADSKGFFGVRSYSEKVKLAAGKAVASITRR
jgi:HEAT repeat protein